MRVSRCFSHLLLRPLQLGPSTPFQNSSFQLRKWQDPPDPSQELSYEEEDGSDPEDSMELSTLPYLENLARFPRRKSLKRKKNPHRGKKHFQLQQAKDTNKS